MPAQKEPKAPLVVVEKEIEIPPSNEIPKIIPDDLCPVCGKKLIYEKCKVVCRSELCIYRLVFNCSEY